MKPYSDKLTLEIRKYYPHGRFTTERFISEQGLPKAMEDARLDLADDGTLTVISGWRETGDGLIEKVIIFDTWPRKKRKGGEP